MCGRTACTLAPDQICKACSGNETRKYQKAAKWRNAPGNAESYKPRFNLAPNVYNPILLAGHHFIPTRGIQATNLDSDDSSEGKDEDISPTDLIVQPMRWGLLPAYHKEDLKFGYSTINARAEGITEKQTFKIPLSKGRRCVVLADGFYEWKRGPKSKQPYFIYFPQDKTINWDHPEEENGGHEWTGRRLLTMAGIFEINRTGENPLYTYSIITVPASKELEWMHDRMPAILDGDEAVDKWLDSENVPLEEALQLLKPFNEVRYHAVTPSMGNVHNQGPECIVPLDKKNINPVSDATQSNILQFFKRPAQAQKSEKSDEKDYGPTVPKIPKKK